MKPSNTLKSLASPLRALATRIYLFAKRLVENVKNIGGRRTQEPSSVTTTSTEVGNRNLAKASNGISIENLSILKTMRIGKNKISLTYDQSITTLPVTAIVNAANGSLLT